jgi:hypothetical protein
MRRSRPDHDRATPKAIVFQHTVGQDHRNLPGNCRWNWRTRAPSARDAVCTLGGDCEIGLRAIRPHENVR